MKKWYLWFWMETMHDVYLLIGGNIGNRALILSQALALIRKRVGRIIRRSSVYETEPWGFEDQRPFLNQVLRVRTALTPGSLLSAVLQIELVLGRIRQSEQYHARTIDIDILFYDSEIISQKQLTIPHPLLHRRRFTLVPLAEIAPSLVHPVFNSTVEDLLAVCTDSNLVEAVALEPDYGLTPKTRNGR